MTVEEIFNKLASHMVEGIMYHDDMAKAYDFLGLSGFARCHDYHHICETKEYRQLSHYYSTHFHKLIKLEQLKQPQIVPDSWYKYTTLDVDTSTKRNAVKELMEKWVAWEKETKILYQTMRRELYSINEVAAALEIDCLICDVDEELTWAEKKWIKLETVGYDIQLIVEWSNELHKKYKQAVKI